MKVSSVIIEVKGVKFEKYSDLVKRGTYATNLETGETKVLRSSGYVSSKATIVKRIKDLFFNAN